METIKRLSELEPGDVSIVERLFGHPLNSKADGLLILRVPDEASRFRSEGHTADIPTWFDVLEGLDDADLADFDATLEMPVRLARSKS